MRNCTWLKLTLHALIENEVKFSPVNTAVEIKVTVPKADLMCIEIIDAGIVIPKEAQEKIFEPFIEWSI